MKEVPSGIDLFEEIARLKRDRNAVILAHYYQEPDIQDVADYIGDSLGLSQEAAKTPADVIVFAGVHFMAETAKILNPSKKVVLPDLEAGCSLADGCPADLFGALKARHPDHFVISYINCTAAVKALSDVICTSSNAEKIVRSVPASRPILFAPDRNLGAYLVKKTGREMLLWQGTCVVHETFSERRIVELKVEHPDAKLIAHPECEEAVLRHADFIGSTTGLLQFAIKNDATKLIVATEAGILHQMRKACPGKTFIPAPPTSSCSCNECPFMKRHTLEKLYLAMRDLAPEVTLPEELRLGALAPIERMLELS
ncbi:MAG: quinolinate synthase NadA [Deltaproteobacteria bacterium]|nr:quinolinate synthase NadA [Deltaproteobacteria bacterium]